MENCTRNVFLWAIFTHSFKKCYLSNDFTVSSLALFFSFLLSWLQASVRSARCALVAHEIKCGWDLVQNRKATHTWFQRLWEYLRFWENAICVCICLSENKQFRVPCFITERNKYETELKCSSSFYISGPQTLKWQEPGWQTMIQCLC